MGDGDLMKKKNRFIIRLTLLIIFALAIGYMLYSNFNSDAGVVGPGDMAPDFRLTTLAGDEVQLSDYRGQGVFLNFWATYCPPCEEEMPYIESQYHEFKDKGVVVLTVDVGEPKLTVESFVKRHNLSFPVLLDQREEIIKLYGIGPIPVTFLIDKDGKVIDRVTKGLTEEEIRNMMLTIQP